MSEKKYKYLNEFSIYQRVLVRNNNNEKWIPKFFSHTIPTVDYVMYVTTDGEKAYHQCIDYGSHKSEALSTSDNCKATYEIGSKLTYNNHDCIVLEFYKSAMKLRLYDTETRENYENVPCVSILNQIEIANINKHPSLNFIRPANIDEMLRN